MRLLIALLTALLIPAAQTRGQQLAPDPKVEQTFYCAAFYRERVATIPAIAVETRDAIEDSAADLRTKLEIEHKIKLDARQQMALLGRLLKESDIWRAQAGGAALERSAVQRFQADAAACQGAMAAFAKYQSARQCMAGIQSRAGATIIDCARESGLNEGQPIIEHCGRMAACVGFATGLAGK